MDLISASHGCGCDGCRQGAGCCEPRALDGTLPYRARPQRELLERLRERVREKLPEAHLPHRSGDERDDPTLGLLDAWATMAHVVSFYQERIAAEGYLRTATEERSLRELAAMVGHEPRPPTSATAWLAMEAEDAPETGGETLVRAGAQVQSVPGKGEDPQVFEVARDATLRWSWNELRPRRTLSPPMLGVNQQQRFAVLQRAQTRWVASAGSVVELFLEKSKTALAPGDLLVLVGWAWPASGPTPVPRSAAARIESVEIMDDGVQRVTLDTSSFAEQTP